MTNWKEYQVWINAEDIDDTSANPDNLSRFNSDIEMIMEDGSHFLWKNAYLKVHPEYEWIGVITEHYGNHVFNLDDIKEYAHGVI
jgi:hypothetical protein